MISDTALREFKQIWLAEFGEDVSDEIAVGEAVNLLTMLDVVYRPIKQSDIDNYENEYGTHLSISK